jgi:hypothetical protein
MQFTLRPPSQKGRASPHRSATFEARAPGRGLLTIAAGSDTTAYGLVEIGSDIGGRGFELAKQGGDGEVYHVLIDNDINTRCDCIAGLLEQGRCRHVVAVQTLIANGALPKLCPGCLVRFANRHGHPCSECQAEIEQDLTAISYNCRRDRRAA